MGSLTPIENAKRIKMKNTFIFAVHFSKLSGGSSTLGLKHSVREYFLLQSQQ
jgi:hypothetical protein